MLRATSPNKAGYLSILANEILGQFPWRKYRFANEFKFLLRCVFKFLPQPTAGVPPATLLKSHDDLLDEDPWQIFGNTLARWESKALPAIPFASTAAAFYRRVSRLIVEKISKRMRNDALEEKWLARTPYWLGYLYGSKFLLRNSR